MILNISKPIIFFDIEATGLDTNKDRIVELSYLKVYPDGNEECKTFRFNPGIKISKSAYAVHKISDKDVANCPKFAELAHKIAEDFRGCDIAGYNSTKFDVPMLAEEMYRANADIDFHKIRQIDVQVIFHKKEPRTLSAAYKFYCGNPMEGAHVAENDVKATYAVLKSQLEKYPDLKNDIAYLSNFTQQKRYVDFDGRLIYNDNGEEVINFGKYKGRKAKDVLNEDRFYLSWILKGDFSQDTKHCFTQIALSAKK